MPVTITPAAPSASPPAGQSPATEATPVVTNQPIANQLPPDLAALVGSDNGTVATSTTVAGSTTLPTVRFARPPIAGEVSVDRGDDAEFMVAHTFVGTHGYGSRVARSDFPETTDFDRLVRLGALFPLKTADAAQPAESDAGNAAQGDTASPDGAPDPAKRPGKSK